MYIYIYIYIYIKIYKLHYFSCNFINVSNIDESCCKSRKEKESLIVKGLTFI